MTQVIYSMQFTGKAVPANESGSVLKANTRGKGCGIRTVVGPQGVSGALETISGDEATFESQVTFTGDNTFLETGTIVFGSTRHKLRFSTVGQGYIFSSVDPQLKHGSVIWKIEGGEGQFEQASGLITSNFLVGASGEVTDNHFGVIFLK